MVVYCPSCGVENPASARFCDQCGAALIPVTSPVPIATPVPQSVQAAVPPPRPMVSSSSAGSITCPQCGAGALAGEAFCDTCGAPLSAPAPATPGATPMYNRSLPPAQTAYPTPQPAPAVVPATAPIPAVPSYTPARTSLAPARFVFDTGVVVLPDAAQAIIGRADAVSNYTPEIDLTDHGALGGGVGRRHARLLIQQGQVALEDLDSTNGTLVNTVRLQPRQPQVLQDGDKLQFGNVRVQFHL